jgi:hypothetical protein
VQRIFKPAIEQVADDRFQVSIVCISFPPDPASAAEIIHDEVDILIVAIWDDRGRPAALE